MICFRCYLIRTIYCKFRMRQGYNKVIQLVNLSVWTMPRASKHSWTQQQDDLLRKMVESSHSRPRWMLLAQKMQKQFGGRFNGKQCRQRWKHYLDPELKRHGFTQQEHQKMAQIHGQVGNRWAIIAQQLPGRTDNSVKNYFYSFIRKRINRINQYLTSNRKNCKLRHILAFQSNFIRELMGALDVNKQKNTAEMTQNAKKIVNHIFCMRIQMFQDKQQMGILLDLMRDFRTKWIKKSIKSKSFQDQDLSQEQSSSFKIRDAFYGSKSRSSSKIDLQEYQKSSKILISESQKGKYQPQIRDFHEESQQQMIRPAQYIPKRSEQPTRSKQTTKQSTPFKKQQILNTLQSGSSSKKSTTKTPFALFPIQQVDSHILLRNSIQNIPEDNSQQMQMRLYQELHIFRQPFELMDDDCVGLGFGLSNCNMLEYDVNLGEIILAPPYRGPSKLFQDFEF